MNSDLPRLIYRTDAQEGMHLEVHVKGEKHRGIVGYCATDYGRKLSVNQVLHHDTGKATESLDKYLQDEADFYLIEPAS